MRKVNGWLCAWLCAGVAGPLALPAAAQQGDLHYDYVQADFARVDLDVVDVAFRGIGLSGSWLVSPEIFVFGGIGHGDTSRIQEAGLEGRFNLQSLTAGAGYRVGVNDQLDFNLGAAFERQRVRGRGDFNVFGCESDNGFSLSAGLRYLLIPAVELTGTVTYVDIIEDDTLLTVGALGHVWENIAVRASYTFGSDWTGYNLGLRYAF